MIYTYNQYTVYINMVSWWFAVGDSTTPKNSSARRTAPEAGEIPQPPYAPWELTNRWDPHGDPAGDPAAWIAVARLVALNCWISPITIFFIWMLNSWGDSQTNNDMLFPMIVYLRLLLYLDVIPNNQPFIVIPYIFGGYDINCYSLTKCHQPFQRMTVIPLSQRSLSDPPLALPAELFCRHPPVGSETSSTNGLALAA